MAFRVQVEVAIELQPLTPLTYLSGKATQLLVTALARFQGKGQTVAGGCASAQTPNKASGKISCR